MRPRQGRTAIAVLGVAAFAAVVTWFGVLKEPRPAGPTAPEARAPAGTPPAPGDNARAPSPPPTAPPRSESAAAPPPAGASPTPAEAPRDTAAAPAAAPRQAAPAPPEPVR